MLLFNVTIVVQSFYPNSACVVFLKQPVSIRAPHCLKRAVHLIARNSCVKFYTFFIFLIFLLFEPYSGWAFSGLLTDGGAKRPPLPKICQTYPTMMKLGKVILYLKRPKNYMNHVMHPLSSADSSIFSSEISKFCYIRKYRYRLHFGI